MQAVLSQLGDGTGDLTLRDRQELCNTQHAYTRIQCQPLLNQGPGMMDKVQMHSFNQCITSSPETSRPPKVHLVS
jgi:hypothetical protein